MLQDFPSTEYSPDWCMKQKYWEHWWPLLLSHCLSVSVSPKRKKSTLEKFSAKFPEMCPP
jgi:hypothetical protein